MSAHKILCASRPFPYFLALCYSSQVSDNQCLCLEASQAGPNHSSLHLRLLSSDLSSSSLTSCSLCSDSTGFWACLPMSGQLDLQKSNVFGWFSGFTSASFSCPGFKFSLGCCRSFVVWLAVLSIGLYACSDTLSSLTGHCSRTISLSTQ